MGRPERVVGRGGGFGDGSGGGGAGGSGGGSGMGGGWMASGWGGSVHSVTKSGGGSGGSGRGVVGEVGDGKEGKKVVIVGGGVGGRDSLALYCHCETNWASRLQVAKSSSYMQWNWGETRPVRVLRMRGTELA